jgi:GNAT superfamily N-acetyltransferase
VDIRQITPDDWQVLRATRLAALKDSPEAFESRYEDALGFDEERWRQRAEQLPTFLAFDGTDPIGMAGGIDEGRPRSRELISMWVSPSARGHGLTARLIDVVADWARADGADELSLWVVLGNASAQAAYDRAGFVATGEQHPVRGGDDRMEERMVLALR